MRSNDVDTERGVVQRTVMGCLIGARVPPRGRLNPLRTGPVKICRLSSREPRHERQARPSPLHQSPQPASSAAPHAVTGTKRETSMTWNDHWPQLAACKDDPEEMFVKGAEQHRAKKRCLGCPVRTECLAEALDNEL